jgi:TolB-like protein
MKKHKTAKLAIAILTATACLGLAAKLVAQEPPAPPPLPDTAPPPPPTMVPVAVLQFDERGEAVEGYGAKVTDMLFAELVANPTLYLVNREDMQRILDETELNLSGMVTPDKATRVGQLTGAKLLLTGSVFEVDDTLYLVAKIIGTETSRVLGASVKGAHRDGLQSLTPKLARNIEALMTDRAPELLPPPTQPEDVIADLKQKLAGHAPLPTLAIRVNEQHIGRPVIDPAVQTELIRIARAVGFEVIDPERGDAKDADISISGDAFSEFAARRSNLVSVKARVELKAVDPQSGRVLLADRQTAIAIDLAENIAAKAALQQAAENLVKRLLPRIVQ